MKSGISNWSWPEIEPVLLAFPIDVSEVILCGGQAVAYWSGCFGLQVVVSRDLDFVGDRFEARQVATALGARISYPDRYDMTVLTAVVQAVWEGRALAIEWLSIVPGVEADPEAISEIVLIKNFRRLRILHPIALAMAKLHALRYFDQTERNDARHLAISLDASARWLAGLLDRDPPRTLRLIHQWFRFVRSRGNQRVLNEGKFDWKAAIPFPALTRAAKVNPLVERFLADHWPRLMAELG